MVNATVGKMTRDDMDHYMFAVSKMGWINCDRFLNSPEKKINYIVRTEAPNESRMSLVLPDFHCIMPGTLMNGYVVFKNIPENANVRVLGISHKDGKAVMASATTRAIAQDFELKGYRSFTLAELETEINGVSGGVF
jgi:hypothetical protein